MKIIKILFSIFVFIIGIMIGIWFVEVETIPTKTTIDIITFIATIIGAAATLLGFILAAYVFYSWKKQQVDQAVIESNIALIIAVNTLEVALSRYIVTKGRVCFRTQQIELNLAIKHYYVMNENALNGQNLKDSTLLTWEKDPLKLVKKFRALAKYFDHLDLNEFILFPNNESFSITNNEHIYNDQFNEKFNGNDTGEIYELLSLISELADEAALDIRITL